MIRKNKSSKKELSTMIKTFGETTDPNRLHNYKRIEIVEIDGKKRVKRKRDGKIMHANKEVSRDNTKRKIRR